MRQHLDALFAVERTNDTFTAREIWKNKNLKAKFASAVYWQGYIYGLDEDILVCLDAQTGQRKWKDGRFGYGQVLLASGHLVVLGGNGDLALVKASPVTVALWRMIHGKSSGHFRCRYFCSVSGSQLQPQQEHSCAHFASPHGSSPSLPAVPISPGTQQVTVSITVVYAA